MIYRKLFAIGIALLVTGSGFAQDSASNRTARRDASVYIEQAGSQYSNIPGLGLGIVYRQARKRDDFLWWKGGLGYGRQSTPDGTYFSQAPAVQWVNPGDSIRVSTSSVLKSGTMALAG